MIDDTDLLVAQTQDGSLVVIPRLRYDSVAQNMTDIGMIILNVEEGDPDPSEDLQDRYKADQTSTQIRTNVPIQKTPSNVAVVANASARDRFARRAECRDDRQHQPAVHAGYDQGLFPE